MITKDMLIGEAVSQHPELAEYLTNFGMFCVGCPGAQFETIEQGLKIHGKTDKEIDKFIEEVNKNLK
jgi:hybrid cluster-associated redox disulfide protein